MNLRTHLALGLIAALSLSLCGHGTVGPAPAGGRHAVPPFLMQGRSLLASTCAGSIAVHNTQLEPSLAVDPGNDRHLVVSWMQDQGRAGPLAMVAGYSYDAGATWSYNVVPGGARCAGGPYDFVSDPWVSIGVGGTAYVTFLGLTGDQSSIVASTSADGGRHWGPPISVAQAPGSDREMVLADPATRGRATIIWADFATDASGQKTPHQILTSTTSDGGITWSEPAALNQPGRVNHILPLSSGGILDVYTDTDAIAGVDNIWATRNTDGTWTTPVNVTTLTETAALDPRDHSLVAPSGAEITAASGPDGWAYVTWMEDSQNVNSAIYAARSRDGGRTWSAPLLVLSNPTNLFMPRIAVAPDGSVAVLYYAFDPSAERGSLSTSVWLARSSDHGSTWRSHRLAGPFDMRTAPQIQRGWYVGDYMGLVGTPSGFSAAFVVAQPISSPGPTSMMFTSGQ